jgi:hypothetical protein
VRRRESDAGRGWWQPAAGGLAGGGGGGLRKKTSTRQGRCEFPGWQPIARAISCHRATALAERESITFPHAWASLVGFFFVVTLVSRLLLHPPLPANHRLLNLFWPTQTFLAPRSLLHVFSTIFMHACDMHVFLLHAIELLAVTIPFLLFPFSLFLLVLYNSFYYLD